MNKYLTFINLKYLVLLLFLSDNVFCKIFKKRATCDSSIDLTVVSGDCTKFYRCSNGFLYTLDCPSGLYFDNSLKSCNYPSQVSCISTSSSSSSTTAAAISTGLSCVSSVDLTSVPSDCSKFYKCGSGLLYIFNCPSGLYFDSTLKVCNYASLVTCNSVTTTTVSLNCLTLANTNVPGDCSTYYTCVSGILRISTCPSGYAFDTDLKYCRIVSTISGKCGPTKFPYCTFTFDDTFRIAICKSANFASVYPNCC